MSGDAQTAGGRTSSTLTDDERFDLALLRRAQAYQRWVLEQFGDALRGDVLEVGAGIGNFTRWMAMLASRVVACEPDEEMCQEIERLQLPNVTVISAPLERLPAESQFDSVAILNVLEHLDQDGLALKTTFALLRPGGAVCILVPAHRLLFGSLDRRYKHIRRYDTARLRRLLTDAGLRVTRLRYFNPVGALGWFVTGRLLRLPRLTLAAVRISENVAVPVGRWLERLGPTPFGQSIVAVAVRPSHHAEGAE